MAEIHELVLKSDSTQIKKGAKDLDGLAVSAGKAEQSTKKTTSGMFKLGVATVGATAGIYSIQKALVAVGKTGFAFNKALEDAKGGLVSLSVAMQDSSIPLTERYAKANKEATESLTKLVAVNTQTPHSLNETNKIYKAMYVSMKNAGATTNEMIELTRGISIAAGSAGIEFNSLLAGVDGLATGTVLANSDLGRFLGGLGLTNKKLKESTDVVALLNNKFKDFKAIDSYTVAASNLDNAWQQLAGELTKDIFSVAKEGMKDLAVDFNEFTEAVKKFKLEMSDINEAKGLSSMNAKMISLGEEWSKYNQKFLDNDFFIGDAWLQKRKEIEGQILLLSRKMQGVAIPKASDSDSSSSQAEKIKAQKKLNAEKEKQLEIDKSLLEIAIQENDARNEATQALETYNESLQATRDTYTNIVGSDYDKWLMNTNNTMAELAATGALTAEELQKVNDVLDH